MKKAILLQLPEEKNCSIGEENPASLVQASTTPAKIEHDDSPAWFRSYLSWHAQARSKLNETNWQHYDYLLLRCVPVEVCEGASDRLKHVPVMVMLAAKKEPKRLFFIHWSKPCALEEFLIPPAGGLDWTLPPWLADKIQANSMIGPYLRLDGHDLKGSWDQIRGKVVRLNKMLYAHGVFEAFRDPDRDPDFWTSYGSIWNAVFTPSPGVQAAIDKTKRDLGIELGNYNGIHVRARYAKDEVNNRVERYALQCLLSLPNATKTNAPVFIAADSSQTIREAVAHGKSQNMTVVGRVNATEPLHLDRGSAFLEYGGKDWQNHAPSEFYDTFVDLYILAGSTCILHGDGGYGSWATLMGASRTCSVDYKRNVC
jgi:hypothetical protein